MKKYFIILVATILLSGCTEEMKNPPPFATALPPITEEGKNTFGCMIEDELFVPVIRRILLPPQIQYEPIEFKFSRLEDYYGFNVSVVRYVAKHDILTDVRISFLVYNIYYSDIPITLRLKSGNITYDQNRYQIIPQTSSITINKLDTVQKIVAGQFHFQALELDNQMIPDPNGRVITISNGRFDLKK